MKTMPIFLVASLALVSTATIAANPVPAAAERADVTFVNPEKFTDANTSFNGGEQGRDANLGEIRRYMLHEAQRFIPAGDHLSISVTDVDLAGDFEPQHGPDWTDIRVMRDVYPPRVALSFKLTDSSGQVIKSGTRTLQNLDYLREVTTIMQSDSLRYDKTLIDDWFRREFGQLK